jgi:hypothetical protein
MRRFYPVGHLLLFTLFLVFDTYAQSNGKGFAYALKLRRYSNSPNIDGHLSPGEWKGATVATNFVQREPKEGEPASERTVVLISYDDDYVYFGIRCFDSEPEKIVANEMRRDYDLSDNDYFEIIIDTYHDRRNGYYFATNPLGAKLDAEVRAEGESINWDWDGIWEVRASRDRRGWSAEIAIPFKTLHFPKNSRLTWGINFGRHIPRKREEAYWTPILRDYGQNGTAKFRISRYGILYGLRNVKPGMNIKLKPYAIGGLQRSEISGARVLDRVRDVGFDAKIGITPNMTADLTLNTDFAQVEADREEVNLTRFDIFYPEKRDFFLEGADIFRFGEYTSGGQASTALFFSRRIGLTDARTEVPIIGGAKLTGKAGRFDIGFLNVYTEGVSYRDPWYDTEVSLQPTNYSALRIKRDVFERSSIGLIALSKDPRRPDDSFNRINRAFGIDGRFAFFNNLTVNAWLAKTHTPGLRGSDRAGSIDLNWGNDLINVNVAHTDIGRNFNPEMGFILWTDIRKSKVSLTIAPRPQAMNIRQMYFFNEFNYYADHDGVLQYRQMLSGIFSYFGDGATLYFGYSNTYENLPYGFVIRNDPVAFVPPGVYRYSLASVEYQSDGSRNFSYSFRGGGGEYYGGSFAGVTVSARLRPTKRFSASLTYNANRLNLPIENGKFSTHVIRGRLSYTFTPNLFVKAFLQWNAFEKRIVSNVLLNLIHRPGSDFYLVYNDIYDTRSTLRISNRTVAAKFTYLFTL